MNLKHDIEMYGIERIATYNVEFLNNAQDQVKNRIYDMCTGAIDKLLLKEPLNDYKHLALVAWCKESYEHIKKIESELGSDKLQELLAEARLENSKDKNYIKRCPEFSPDYETLFQAIKNTLNEAYNTNKQFKKKFNKYANEFRRTNLQEMLFN